MFLYDKDKELENFKNSFGFYLPLYTKNEDNINSLNISGDYDEYLRLLSRRIWPESTTIPHRKTRVAGIYGELFMDIYMRIVRKRNLLLTFASKITFNSNQEIKGIDTLLYDFNNNEIELYLGEAKFVQDVSKARHSLLQDISHADVPHLSEEFLNKYISFALEKGFSAKQEHKNSINEFFNELNKRMNDISKPESFVDFLIDKNIKINFVCFAIFKGNYSHPDELNNIYETLFSEIEKQFDSMKIKNYEAEIVFIATSNPSMTIKMEIDSFYE